MWYIIPHTKTNIIAHVRTCTRRTGTRGRIFFGMCQLETRFARIIGRVSTTDHWLNLIVHGAMVNIDRHYWRLPFPPTIDSQWWMSMAIVDVCFFHQQYIHNGLYRRPLLKFAIAANNRVTMVYIDGHCWRLLLPPTTDSQWSTSIVIATHNILKAVFPS